MASSLHFAHITDVHVSEHERSWGTLGTLAERLLRKAIAHLNTLDDLDFVLFTGDLLDRATPPELERLMAALGTLHKPWHLVAGNHDGYLDPQHPEAYAPHEALPLIDPRMADPPPEAQRACWSREVGTGMRLIGLDSRKPDTWAGEVGAEQLLWLMEELDAHRRDLILIAVHHPLHYLTPRNIAPWWSNFICTNGQQVEMLLDAFPNVRLVLSGHHHANHISRRGGRLHISTGALGGYPCMYRTIRLEQVGDGWRVQVSTHLAADEEEHKLALEALLESPIARRYKADDPSAWAQFVLGRPEDRTFEGVLR